MVTFVSDSHVNKKLSAGSFSINITGVIQKWIFLFF